MLSLNICTTISNNNNFCFVTYLYFFDHAEDADCDGDADWTEASSQHTYYGTEPAGMSGYRAAIKSDNSSCSQNQSLITRRWTATESTMSISFSYSLLLAILAYPSSGTPFVDHHSAFFSLLGIYTLIAAIKTEKGFFWILFDPDGLAWHDRASGTKVVFLGKNAYQNDAVEN